MLRSKSLLDNVPVSWASSQVFCLFAVNRLGVGGKAEMAVTVPLGGPELLQGKCEWVPCKLHMTYVGHRFAVSAAPTPALFDPPLSLQVSCPDLLQSEPITVPLSGARTVSCDQCCGHFCLQASPRYVYLCTSLDRAHMKAAA